jgi:hypothetical protein
VAGRACPVSAGHSSHSPHTPVTIVLTRDESQLRQLDKDCHWSAKGGIWILRTTRQWLTWTVLVGNERPSHRDARRIHAEKMDSTTPPSDENKR